MNRRQITGQAPPTASASPSSDGNDGGFRRDVHEYLEILRRRWWLILAACVVSVGMTWWSQRDDVPTYTAQVLLQVRPDAGDGPLGLGLSSQGLDFGSQVEIIRSRSVIAPVVDSLGLQFILWNERRRDWTDIVGDVRVEPDPPGGGFVLRERGGRLVLRRTGEAGEVIATGPIDEPIEGPGFSLRLADPRSAGRPIPFGFRNREATVQAYQRRIRVEPGRGSNLLRIAYTDPDPRRAAGVANAVAESYHRHRAEAARQAASRRRSVIASQLIELADSLRAVQDLLLTYQQSQEMLDPAAEGSALLSARLSTEGEIRKLRYEEGMLQSLIAGLRSAQENNQRMDEVMTLAAGIVPSGQGLHQRLRQLEDERSRLTASRFGFTESEPRVQVLDSLMASVRNQMRVAAEQALELTRSRLSSERERLGELRYEVSALPERSAELERYQQRVDAVQSVFDMLVEKYYEAQIAEGVEVGDVDVVDPAAVPLRPDPANPRFQLLVALVVGLVVGGAGALTVEQLDSRVRRPGEAAKISRLEVLGQIPHLSSTKNGSESALVGKESIRAIRTTIRFASADGFQVLAVTSAEPREGKTTTAANLALTFVEQGAKTLAIDADLRRPALHETLRVRLAPGLTDVLRGRVPVQDAIVHSPLPGNIHLLPRGTEASNAPELVAGDGFERLIEELRDEYEIILIDTPPVLAVSDTAVIARVADAMVVVARANSTQEEVLEEAVSRLRRVDAPLIGLILNAVRRDRLGYAKYYSYYGKRPGEGGKKKKKPSRLIG